MKKRIRFSLIIIALLAVIMSAFTITYYYYDLFEKQAKEDLKSTAAILENYDLNSYTSHLSESGNIRITWIDKDGSVIYDNDVNASELENHNDRPEVQAAFNTGTGEAKRLSNTFGMNTYYYAVKLEDGTVLRLSKDTRSLSSVFLKSIPLIIGISCMISLVCILISTWLTKKLLEPIETTINQLDNPDVEPKYKELVPFITTINQQHEAILASAKIRQDFSANVSHELKTPLTVISGYAELIENKMVDATQQIHFAQEIRKNAERLVALINDIIRLSELDSTKEKQLEEVDLYNIIELVLPNIEELAKQKNISFDYRGTHAVMLGNPTLLEELVYNLCQNAIQYNKVNGSVTLEVINESQIELIVKDTGIGIPKVDQQHIFERFYRVDKSRSKKTGGTGLGLAIVKHIVEYHDAHIELESEENVGTTIKVTF